MHGVGTRTRFTYRCNMIWTPHSMCIHLWDRPLHCTLHTCVKEWGWPPTFKTYVYTYLNTHTCPRNGMTTSAIRYLYMHIYTSTGWDVHRLQCTYICACGYIMNRMARTIPHAYIQGMESPLIALYMYTYICKWIHACKTIGITTSMLYVSRKNGLPISSNSRSLIYTYIFRLVYIWLHMCISNGMTTSTPYLYKARNRHPLHSRCVYYICVQQDWDHHLHFMYVYLYTYVCMYVQGMVCPYPPM